MKANKSLWAELKVPKFRIRNTVDEAVNYRVKKYVSYKVEEQLLESRAFIWRTDLRDQQ